MPTTLLNLMEEELRGYSNQEIKDRIEEILLGGYGEYSKEDRLEMDMLVAIRFEREQLGEWDEEIGLFSN